MRRWAVPFGRGSLLLIGALLHAQDGAAIFQRECAACHNGAADSRAPSREVLAQRSPEGILQALSAGTMRPQGAHLSGNERRAVAEFLSGKKISGDVTGASTGRCETQRPFSATPPLWSNWGASLTNTRFQPADQAGLTAAQVPHLVLKWALGFPDATSAWSQPTVAGGRLFVGSHNGTVFSLDAKTGCIYWTYSAKGAVRSSVVVSGNAVYFGDNSATAYALDAATGKELWSRKVEEHPYARISGSPAVYEGRVYVGVASFEETVGSNPNYECCTFRGTLNALDAKTGAVVWRTYLVPQPKPAGKSATGKTLWGPSGAGIWSAPTIDVKRGLIYAGTGNTYTAPQLDTSDAIVAFDLKTGKIKWTKQATPKDVFISGCRAGSKNPICPEEVGPDFDFGQPPILTKLADGKDVLIVGQKSGVGYALDPDKEGAVMWQYRAGEGSALGGLEWGSAVDGENAYFPVSDIIRPKPGGLHAVNLATGKRVWYAEPPPPKCGTGRGCNAAQTAAITVIPGVIFSGSNDGAIRAYSTKDGSILWEYDTNREFTTLNGVPSKSALWRTM
ncbi:MAG: PQQ-binding-like beta-propeller repeat protein [Acidobacteriia bacterium]|nr:PQQ-binding-like beta-propeller repeat protein [Terriglobia bacterium]